MSEKLLTCTDGAHPEATVCFSGHRYAHCPLCASAGDVRDAEERTRALLRRMDELLRDAAEIRKEME